MTSLESPFHSYSGCHWPVTQGKMQLGSNLFSILLKDTFTLPQGPAAEQTTFISLRRPLNLLIHGPRSDTNEPGRARLIFTLLNLCNVHDEQIIPKNSGLK